ncbi:MAG: hypothetical protein KAS12_01180 [Candidatus Aenigmarchaeota archaeon]|nr:hypothetical protein [Candidatus Aenigmarchaeota archaeon]
MKETTILVLISIFLVPILASSSFECKNGTVDLELGTLFFPPVISKCSYSIIGSTVFFRFGEIDETINFGSNGINIDGFPVDIIPTVKQQCIMELEDTNAPIPHRLIRFEIWPTGFCRLRHFDNGLFQASGTMIIGRQVIMWSLLPEEV